MTADDTTAREQMAAPGPSATEAAVDALITTMRHVFGAMPGARWTESPDLVRYSSGLAAPRFNGVVVLGRAADEDLAAAWLTDLERAGVPCCVLARPAALDWAAALAAHHGLDTVWHEPFMVLDDPASVAVPDRPVIERVDPADVDAVREAQQLVADGFEGPLDLLGPLMSTPVISVPGHAAWVGRSDEGPCTVGLGAVQDGHIGVFNIATPPEHRRRGHGRAMTARVVAEGVAAGAHTAYLQASELGFPVYEAMGFRTVEAWPCHYPG